MVNNPLSYSTTGGYVTQTNRSNLTMLKTGVLALGTIATIVGSYGTCLAFTTDPNIAWLFLTVAIVGVVLSGLSLAID